MVESSCIYENRQASGSDVLAGSAGQGAPKVLQNGI